MLYILSCVKKSQKYVVTIFIKCLDLKYMIKIKKSANYFVIKS